MSKNIDEEIKRIIYDYIVNNKLVDRDFLYKIVDIIVMAQSLNDYVRDLNIYKKPIIPGCATTYNADNREINVFWQELIECVNLILSSESMSSFERLVYAYEFVACSLLHESVHARQEKEKNEKKGTIKEKILSLSVSFVEYSNETANMSPDERAKFREEKEQLWKKYQEYHDYAPCEREAHIEESALEVFLTTELNKKLKGLDTLLNKGTKLLEKDFLLGYDEGLVPANYYFEQLGLSNEWGLLIPQTKILTPEEKVIYGLEMPLTEVKAEYHKLVRKRIR